VSGPAYDASIAPIAFDPAAAVALLDEAGWRDRDADGVRDRFGVRLEFEFLLPAGNKPIEELASLWMEELSSVGVSMKVSRMEWAAFVKRFEDKKFDVITLSWAMSPESDPHQLWHSRWADPARPSSNSTSFKDPMADALIEAVQECLDPELRSRYQRALHRIFDADQAYTYLWCRGEIGAYDRRWRGVKLYPRRPGFDLTEWYMPVELRKKP
jgi:peptide/nickel transport system substrate-binding protein